MPDLMQFLRLQNLFGAPQITAPGIAGGDFMPPQDFSQAFSPQPDPYGNISFGPATQQAMPAQTPMLPTQAQPTGGFDVGARMRELYQPETMAQDRFNTMLGEYPEATKPGWLKVIGATLADLARPGTGMQVVEGGRTRKVADWKNKIGAAQDAASLERQTNVNERQLAGTIATQERLSAADQARAEKDAARTKIMQDRAEVYRLKSLRGNFKFNFSGPKVIITDPATGKVEQTDIDTGSLSDADKMALSQDNALELEGVRQEGRESLEGIRQGGRESLAETRGWKEAIVPDPDNPGRQIAILYNQITGESKPLQFGGKSVTGMNKPGTQTGGRSGELPTQTKVRQATAAREFVAKNPALSKYVQFTPGNEFSITPPATGRFSTGPSQDDYNKIVKAIYGDDLPISATRTGDTGTGTPTLTTKFNPNNPNHKRQRSPSTGKIRESYDGGKTWQIVN
jgi:hypothetical protein